MTDEKTRALIADLREYATALRASVHVHHTGADLIEQAADTISALTVPDGDVRERLVESIAGGTISIPGGYGELARDDAESIVDTILGDPVLSRAAAPEPAEQFSYVEKWVDGSGVYERITFPSASEAHEWLRNRTDGLTAFNSEADAEGDRLVASVERRTTYSPGPWEPLPVGGETE